MFNLAVYAETRIRKMGTVSINVLFVWLFRLLLALVLVPSPCWPPPLTCAVSILSNGRTDRNLKVTAPRERKECRRETAE